ALGRRRQHRRGRAPPAHGPAQPLPSHEAPGDRTMSVRVSTRPLAALAAALLAAAPLAAQPGAEAGPELTADAADAVLSLYNRATTVRLHGESILPAGTELAGDLGVLDGPLVLAGRVRGSVVVINGDLRFEPGAEVGGDVIVVGGIVHGPAGARVHGTAAVYREPLRYRRDGDLLVQAPLPEKGSGLSAGRDFRFGRTDFTLAVRGAYNRVEGLPIAGGARIELGRSNPTLFEAVGIYRTESGLRLRDRDLGYALRIEQHMGGRRAVRPVHAPAVAGGGRLRHGVRAAPRRPRPRLRAPQRAAHGRPPRRPARPGAPLRRAAHRGPRPLGPREFPRRLRPAPRLPRLL